MRSLRPSRALLALLAAGAPLLVACGSDSNTTEPAAGAVPAAAPRVLSTTVSSNMGRDYGGSTGANVDPVFDLVRFGLTTSTATLRLQPSPGAAVADYPVVSLGVDNTLTNVRPPILSALPGFVPFTLRTGGALFWRADRDYVVAFTIREERAGDEPLVGIIRQLGNETWIGGIDDDWIAGSNGVSVSGFTRTADCRDRDAVLTSCALGTLTIQSPRVWLYRYQPGTLTVRDSISIEIPRTTVNAAATVLDAPASRR